MARRRVEDAYGEREGEDTDLTPPSGGQGPMSLADILSIGGAVGGDGPPGVGGVVEMAPPLRHRSFGPPDTDTDSDPLGSRESARDLRPPSQTPTTFGPPSGRGSELPQGVTVDDDASGGMFSGVGDGGNTLNMPGQSFMPSPSSGNLTFAPPEGGTMRGPQRRSAQPSVLYSQPNSPTLAGRAGGLMEGGLGATGVSDRTGPLQPTELMERLLQMFRGA